jgi:acyl-CoA thioesterase II
VSDGRPPTSLEEATRLEGDTGRCSIQLCDAWEIWGPSGGYLAAIALRAAGRCARIPRPASFYCHFLSSPAFEEVQITVEVLKRGRRSESLAVEMTQRGANVLHALVRTAAEAPGYQHQEIAAPEIPPPGECVPYEHARPGQPSFNFWNNLARLRPVGDSHESAAAPIVREWIRFRPTPCFDDPFVDAARSLVLLDTFGWPAAYSKYKSWDYIAPNLDTSVWFHQLAPRSEWLLIDHECPVAADGLLGVGGRVWATDGRLLASGGAQLCCIEGRER